MASEVVRGRLRPTSEVGLKRPRMTSSSLTIKKPLKTVKKPLKTVKKPLKPLKTAKKPLKNRYKPLYMAFEVSLKQPRRFSA